MFNKQSVIHTVYLSDGTTQKVLDTNAVDNNFMGVQGELTNHQNKIADLYVRMDLIDNQHKQIKDFVSWVRESYPEVMEGYHAIKELENSL